MVLLIQTARMLLSMENHSITSEENATKESGSGLFLTFSLGTSSNLRPNMSHSQMLGKVESGGGPIFKVVLEC